jgi:Winged helix DNA-binding domain
VRFTHPATWVAGLETADPDEALDEATRRYLHAYGPAAREDLARWWGIPSPARALERIRRLGDEVAEVEFGDRRGVMLAADAAKAAALDPPSTVALLPAFDPYLAGSSRTDTDVLAAEHKARVHRPQGWISPVLLVDGRIAGVWRHERKGDRLDVEIQPFEALPDEARERAEARAGDLARFLGGELACGSPPDAAAAYPRVDIAARRKTGTGERDAPRSSRAMPFAAVRPSPPM